MVGSCISQSWRLTRWRAIDPNDRAAPLDGNVRNEPIDFPKYTETDQAPDPADHMATGTIFAPAAPGVVHLLARRARFVVEARSPVTAFA
jgi:hypothetical protein